jgi:hypothetical protein
MIPNSALRVVQSNGEGVRGDFKISTKDSAHIMNILRDTLYSDKVLAVLREYGSNAWDAHREKGTPDVPIKITLPTEMDPTLHIRDFGPGLSRDAVLTVYTQYGASTKRSTDNAVGMLGIGCKSGFAYSDSFTVTSWHGGKKGTYVAVLDKNEGGSDAHMDLLDEVDCALEETGVLVQIPVRPSDIEKFVSKAQEIYQYFVPQPEINTELPPIPKIKNQLQYGVIYDKGDDGFRRSYGHHWVAVMGCVSYRIDLNQLRPTDTEEGIPEFLFSLHGALNFKIGELQVNASREGLKYDPVANKVLIERFNLLVEEYVRLTLADVEATSKNPWDRRLKSQMLGQLNLPLPKEWEEIVKNRLAFKEDDMPKGLAAYKGNKVCESISLNEEVRLILRNDHRALAGFGLKVNDVVIRRMDKKLSWPKAEKALADFCEKEGIAGITVLKSSEMTWAVPTRTVDGKTVNIKHRKDFFRLELGPEEYACRPYSDYWEPVYKRPGKNDVFVILNSFETTSYINKGVNFDIYGVYREDIKLATQLGLKSKMPAIYGYKNTVKKPTDATKCKGTHYMEWRQKFIQSLLTPSIQICFETYQWSRVSKDAIHFFSQQTSKNFRKLSHKLGKNHPICAFFRRHRAAKEFMRRRTGLAEGLEGLYERLGKSRDESSAEKALNEIVARYPIISEIGIHKLWGDTSDKWIDYVHLVDQASRNRKAS